MRRWGAKLKPYYEHAGITIYHGDCREILPTLDGSGLTMMIADPPYGVEWQGRRRLKQEMFGVLQGDERDSDFTDALRLALKCLKRRAHVYIFGTADLATLPLTESSQLIWDKEIVGLGDLQKPWGPSHEVITFATVEESQANRWKGDGRLVAKMRRGSVIRVQRLNSEAVVNHPTEKPLMLMRQLIESSSIIGDSVLDPFMGSGSVLEAAHIEGRSAIGIEIEEKYCEIAAKRLSQEVLQFEEQPTSKQEL